MTRAGGRAPVALALATLLAAGCGGPEPLKGAGTVMVRMTEWQQPWFEARVIEFAKSRQVELRVDAYQLIRDVEAALRPGRDGQRPILVKVEGRQVADLVAKGLLRPLEEVVGADRLAADLAAYHPASLEPVRIGGKTWGIPRKLETMVLAYRRSSVREAVSAAPADRARFAALLAAHGLELPAGHELESDPREWDLVDLLEVAHYLSRVPLDGKVAPRFAFRTADIEGTATDMACLAYPLGYAPGRRLEDQPGFERFLDLTRLMHAGGLVPPLVGEGSQTPRIFEGWNRGDVHLSFLQQLDARRLIGGDEVPGFLPDPDDIGFAPIPRGGPWADDPDARPVPSGGWWWCLPAGAPAPDLGYALARQITSPEVHFEECRRFGMMPVLRSLTDDLAEAFPERRLRDLFEVSFESLEGRVPKPPLGGEAYARWRAAMR